jgi:hypothetical protein
MRLAMQSYRKSQRNLSKRQVRFNTRSPA